MEVVLDLFNTIAGAASIISLGFAAFIYYRQRLTEAREEGSLRLLQERMRHVEISLRATGTTLQILIRRADSQDTPVIELQNIARAVRSHLFGALQETSDLQRAMVDWKFGQLLAASALEPARGPDKENEPGDADS
jgi:hypothetical protein